ncbi:phage holin [Siminovitchia fortis]|uniref:Phage holin n=1 Tax=Siminovitchia fortis TaxID=254758 RepID=A0A443IMY5_9BACI|nr:phage holin [Siminovitchia fortis]RWR06761.1 phage holin [Siminovitchia fortis]WHY83030.1 phage holin [Siminovitchia fortis]
MDRSSVARFVVLVVAVINAVLNLVGYQTIPDDFVNDLVAVVSGAWFIWAAWKNNYLSKKGQKQKEQLKRAGLD